MLRVARIRVLSTTPLCVKRGGGVTIDEPIFPQRQRRSRISPRSPPNPFSMRIRSRSAFEQKKLFKCGDAFIAANLPPSAVCIASSTLHAGKTVDELCFDEYKWFVQSIDQPFDTSLIDFNPMPNGEPLPQMWDLEMLESLHFERMVMPTVHAIYFDAGTGVTSLVIAPGISPEPLFINIPAIGAKNIVYHDSFDQAVETPLKPLAIMKALTEEEVQKKYNADEDLSSFDHYPFVDFTTKERQKLMLQKISTHQVRGSAF